MILTAFFLSGAAALIYEILFVRYFSLAFGHTTVAVSSVLAAFMGGLALGSFFGGKLSDRLPTQRLIPAFVLLECLTAATGFLAAGAACASVYHLHITHPIAGFMTAAAIVTIPTVCMGATLPVLVRRLAEIRHDVGTSVAILYGINTAGAVAGALFAGFIGIAVFGMSRTAGIAVCLNLAAAATAYFAHVRNTPEPAPDNHAPIDHTPAVSGTLTRSFSIATLLITGSAAMLCEVAWTRVFALLLGSSTYAFTIMLVTFLLALAGGSWCYALLRRAVAPSRTLLAATLACTAFGLIGYLPLCNILPYVFLKAIPAAAPSPALLLPLLQFFLCGTLMAFPVFCMGFLFPLVTALTRRTESRTGSQTGSLYAAATAGNIGGSAAAGLICVPLLGAENTLVIAGCLYAVCAAVTMLPSARRIPVRIAGLVVCAALFTGSVMARPRWDPFIMSSGIFLYAQDYQQSKNYRSFVAALHRYQLLFHKDGVNSTVTVMQTPWGERFMRINGKTDASTGSDMATQMLQGYLPLLLFPGQPRSALVIGLGSGVTAGALATEPSIASIDCIEIEPAVASAAALFARFNHHVLADNRTRVIVSDARQHLATTNRRYDIISSEPSNPWIAGIAQLFTREAFELTRSRLTPDGIFCQWFHSYGMGLEDFKMVMNTFAGVFPHVMLMTTSHNDFFLLGSQKPWHIAYPAVKERFLINTGLARDLSLVGLGNPFSMITTTFMLDDAAFRSFAASGRTHRDDHPVLEFSAPRYLYHGEDKAIYASLVSAKNTMFPDSLTGIDASPEEQALMYNTAGEAFMRTQDLAQAERMFNQALLFDRNNPQTWTNLGRVFNLKNEHFRARDAFEKALTINASFALAWFHLGMLQATQGMAGEGIKDLETGLRLAPYDPMGNLQTALLYLKQGNNDAAQKLLRRALSRPIANKTLRQALIYTLGVAEQ